MHVNKYLLIGLTLIIIVLLVIFLYVFFHEITVFLLSSVDWLKNNSTVLASIGAVATVIGVIVAIIIAVKSKQTQPSPTPESTPKTLPEIENPQRQTINVSTGLSIEQYENALCKQGEKIKTTLTRANKKALSKEKNKRKILAIELGSIEEKLANIQTAFKDKQQQLAEASQALSQLENELPPAQIEKAQQQLQQGNTDAAKALLDQLINHGSDSIALAAYQRACLAKDEIDYPTAIEHYRKAVILVPDHPDYLQQAGQMAFTLTLYSEAGAWLKKAQSIQAKQSPDSLELASVLNDLALLNKEQGNYAVALDLFTLSLNIYEKDEGYSNVATLLNNLATLHHVQSNYTAALPLIQQSLKIYKKVFGKNNLNVATCRNNLALLYLSLNNYVTALRHARLSLKIRKKLLGKDHPDVANSQNTLARLYQARGQYKKATSLYQQAIIILENKFPSGHPNLDTVKNNYQAMLSEQNSPPKNNP